MTGVTMISNEMMSEQRPGCRICCKTIVYSENTNLFHMNILEEINYKINSIFPAAKIPQRFIIAGMTFLVFVVQIFSIFSFALPLTQMVQSNTNNMETLINDENTCRPYENFANTTSSIELGSSSVSLPESSHKSFHQN